MADNQPENTLDNENRKMDLEIFRRDLNEVHLLMDFISSLPRKSLNDLSLPDPDPTGRPTAPGQIRSLMDPAESVRRISLIRFPPSPDEKKRAEEATLLLLAKDRLNDLARPAR